MTPAELSVLLKELLPSLSPASLIKNRLFIERVWQRSKELESSKHDNNGKQLIKDTINIWNKTLQIVFEDDDEMKHIVLMYFDIEHASLLKQELEKFNGKSATDLLQVKELLKSFAFQSEFYSKKNDWDSYEAMFNKAIDTLSVLSHEDKRSSGIDYLYQVLLSTGFSLSSMSSMSSVQIIDWISRSFKKLLELNTEIPPSHEVLNLCDKDELLLSDQQVKQLLDLTDQIVSEKCKSSLRFYMARVFIIMRCCNSDYQTDLCANYFEAMEKTPIPPRDSDLIDLNTMIKKMSKSRHDIGIQKIMEGLNLLIQRSKQGNSEQRSSLPEEHLHEFKIKLLTDFVFMLKDSKKLDENILKTAIDDVFLTQGESGNIINSEVVQMKNSYEAALPWYKYTWYIIKSPIQKKRNLLTLATKLAWCYDKIGNPNAAYQCLEKCLSDSAEQVTATAQDYLLLIRFAFRQNIISQGIVIPSLLEKLKGSLNFDPCYMLQHVLGYYYQWQYGQVASIAPKALAIILEFYEKNEEDLYYIRVHIHLLVILLRCILHIKTTVYEDLANDGVPRTKDLNFGQVAVYIESLLDLVHTKEMMTAKCIYPCDFQWLIETVYNLGLFCFNAERNNEGRIMFGLIEQLSTYCSSEMLSSFTSEQIRIFTFLTTCVHIMADNENLVLRLFDLPDSPFPLLERIADSFAVLKKFQTKLVDKSIKDYAKWSRILVSVAVARNVKKDLYDCVTDIISQQLYRKDLFPQTDLYYLIVITWNEGIGCGFNTEKDGLDWCNLSISLLTGYKNLEKRDELDKKTQDGT
ncbi:hypothetical protein INT47_005297 [Mucor saturninus]|uniref:Protein ZIP4 homolog n=1 Tax=Mucor saturninus TaxID=64648 RepID=A0A8H7R7D8_9FUNG|nr:hypothetical protein INT47_005297 [Mucor saturninus]